MKKFLNILMWFILLTGFFGMLGFVGVEQKNVKCTGIDIRIHRSDTGIFISEKEIFKLVHSLSDDTLVGRPMKELSIEKIRKNISDNPYAIHVTVFATVDGMLKIDLTQRTPIIRVINDKNFSYYITADGIVVPLSDLSIARVPVVTGLIPEAYVPGRCVKTFISDSSDMASSMSILQQIYVLGEYLNQDDFFRAQIEQIYVNPEGEFEMIPKTGKHLILFGDINDVAGKFENLLAFYTVGMKQVGWNHYKTINIKYKNQVICSKT